MKLCKHNNCNNPVWSGGFCKWHSKRQQIKVISNKRKEEKKEYDKKRKLYLIEHSICEVKECNNKATQIHHKVGRVGNNYTDESTFLAVCASCHKQIEENPQWAKDNNYSINRLNNGSKYRKI